MIDISLTGGASSSGGLTKSFNIAPFVKLGDNLAVGMSQDSSLNAATGTLYPINLPAKATGDTMQSTINTLFNTEAQQYYPIDDQQYDVNEVKLKVGEAFFTKYKKIVALLYSSFTASIKQLPNSTIYITNLFKLEWMSTSKFVMLYSDNSTGYVLKLVAASVGSDGLLTWGTPQTMKTFTDATHYNYAAACMAVTDTDKILVTYTNKVSTSYYLKARVVTAVGTALTPQSEGADNTNFGTSGPFQLYGIRISNGSGAGAVALSVPAVSGAASLTKLQVISHDNANSISYGAATVDNPSVASINYTAMFSYASNKFIVASKDGGTTHAYARIYTVSGTTITAAGAGPLAITDVTSNSHYLGDQPHLNWINFGSNKLGLPIAYTGSWRAMAFDITSDVLTRLDNGNNSTMSSTAAGNGTRTITKGNGNGLFYSQRSGGSNYIITNEISYAGGRCVVQNAVDINIDNGAITYAQGMWLGSSKAFFTDNTTNVSSPMNYQIGAGDTVMQVLDESNTVLATITETADGPAQVKLKALNLTWANTTKLIFKLKNTSAEARVIKISGVYVDVD